MANELKPRRTAYYVAGIIIAIAVALIAYGRRQQQPPVDREELVGFAQCLATSGATFYGTFWCSHCQDQKEMFGSAADQLPYIECSASDGRSQLAVCADNQITGYPTWVFGDGSRIAGKMTFEELAGKTGCPLPQ